MLKWLTCLAVPCLAVPCKATLCAPLSVSKPTAIMANLYQQTVPPFIKYLKNMSHLLQKGAQFCEEKGVKPEELLSFRLVADQRG